VLERLIRAVAVVTSLVVLAGFALFAIDELGEASERTQAELAGAAAPAPTAQQERARDRDSSRPRELIDDANDILLSPFAWVSEDADDRWARRGVPTLLALIVYGFGLGFLARLGHGRA
jgi:hypothetical protein